MPDVPMTWAARERPILESLFELEEEGENRVYSGLVAERTGLPEDQVMRGLVALREAGYYRGETLNGFTQTVIIRPHLTEKGRREIGQWPADSYDALLAALTDRIAREEDATERTKLQRLLDAVTSIGRDVAVDVIGAALKRATGL